jgi:hypothetical protein
MLKFARAKRIRQILSSYIPLLPESGLGQMESFVTLERIFSKEALLWNFRPYKLKKGLEESVSLL